MKHNATIHMGASRFDVTVKAADGTPTTFDLYAMNKDQRRVFHREFMKAYRKTNA
jgi:hypothetical protein